MTDTRDLSQNERELLLKLLAGGTFQGAEALAKQVAFASAVCGSERNFLDLEVSDSAPSAPVPDGEIPVRGLITGSASPEPVGEILVWVERGRLAGLEHASFMDEPPSGFPASGRIRVQAKHAG
jgi:hypothetical protein